MIAISEFKSEVLNYKTKITEIDNIDALLDKSNKTKPLLKLLVQYGERIASHGFTMADNIQFIREKDEAKQMLNICFQIELVIVLSDFLYNYVSDHEVYKVSLKEELSAYHETIKELKEATGDIERELSLLMDNDFNSLMNDIRGKIEKSDL